MVESSADGATWTKVSGVFSVSDTNGWTNSWDLPAEDGDGNPLIYRFTEMTDPWIQGTDRYDHDRYTVTGQQTTSSTSSLTFYNTYNWPWPLIDKADSLYDGNPPAAEKMHASAEGPSLTEGGPEASGPFEAGQELSSVQ